MFPKLWISFWNFRACGGEKAGMGFPYQSQRIAARGSPHRRMRSILLIARDVPRDPDAVRHPTSSGWRRLSECSSQLAAAASCHARGLLQQAWPTCNRNHRSDGFLEVRRGLWSSTRTPICSPASVFSMQVRCRRSTNDRGPADVCRKVASALLLMMALVALATLTNPAGTPPPPPTTTTTNPEGGLEPKCYHGPHLKNCSHFSPKRRVSRPG